MPCWRTESHPVNILSMEGDGDSLKALDISLPIPCGLGVFPVFKLYIPGKLLSLEMFPLSVDCLL